MNVRSFAVAVALLVLGCGSPSEPAESPRPRAKKPPAKALSAFALESALIAQVPGGTYGPYVGRGEGGTLVVWAAQTGGSRKWWARIVAPDGALRAAARELGDSPREIGLVAVKPAAKGSFVVASTRPDGPGARIEGMVVSADGQLAAGPIALSASSIPVRWIDALPTKQGALVLWARQQGDAAELWAAPIGVGGSKSEPRKIVSGARAWQAVAGPNDVTLAVVDADGVSLVRVDASGQAGAEVHVSTTRKAELDLDAARLGDRVVLGWSDRTDFDAQLKIAVVDDTGKLVVPPKQALAAVSGDQALIRIVPPLGGGPAYLVWEVVGERAGGSRSIRLATLTSEAVLGQARGEVRVASDDGTVPELAATPRGIAALTLARSCDKSMTAEACDQAERLPTFIELDRSFAPLATEPMRLAELSGGPAELAWGLGCSLGGCMALAAVATDPAPVYAVKLTARSQRWLPPGGKLEPQAPPRPISVSTLAVLEPLADVAATRIGKTTLVAWITHFDPTTPNKRLTKPAPDGRFEPTRALLQVRAAPDDGSPSAADTVSLRARSLGGVAIAAGPAEQREAMLAWAALDAGEPQVFTTVIGADGKKLRQKMLTHSKGEKSDVAIAAVSDGYVVAWVDERHGDPEVYVAKVNRYLQRVGNERRLTTAAGAATGLSLLTLGDRVLVAWSDARDAERPGSGDPYVAWVKATDLAPIGAAERLATTRAHSFSPSLAAFGSGAVIAWLEADGGGVQIGELDAQGKLVGSASRVRIDGSANGLSLACDAERCRVVAGVDRNERGELVVFERPKSGNPSAPRRLSGLPGPAGQAVAPTLFGELLLYSDQVGDRGRVRQMRIQW